MRRLTPTDRFDALEARGHLYTAFNDNEHHTIRFTIATTDTGRVVITSRRFETKPIETVRTVQWRGQSVSFVIFGSLSPWGIRPRLDR